MILVPIKMPRSCVQCPLCHDFMMCLITGIHFTKEDDAWIDRKRAESCPLKECTDGEQQNGNPAETDK